MLKSSPDPNLISLSTSLYRVLLAFYPVGFKRDYGPHMAQVFRDCCLKAYRQSGLPGILSLWTLTLFDWFKTVVEEQLNRGTEMTHEKFIRMSGWALILAAISLVAGFGFGGGETRYDDPLGGLDGIYEYGQLILIPASLLLYTVGMVGLRARYGETSGWLGNAGLIIATIAGGLSFMSAIPLFALMDNIWMGDWWYLMVYSMLAMLVGLSLFGVSTLRTKPLPRWNALPLLTAIWFPIVFIIGTIMDQIGADTDGIDGYMAFVALLFMFVGSMVLGYVLQSDTPIDEIVVLPKTPGDNPAG